MASSVIPWKNSSLPPYLQNLSPNSLSVVTYKTHFQTVAQSPMVCFCWCNLWLVGGGLILWVFKDGGSTTVLGLWLFVEAWVNEYFKIFFLNAATGKATWLRAPETLLVSLLLLLFLGLLALHPSFQLSFLSQFGCCVMSSLKLFEEMIEPKFPSLDFV